MSAQDDYYSIYRDWAASYNKLYKTWADAIGKLAGKPEKEKTAEDAAFTYEKFYDLMLNQFQVMLSSLGASPIPGPVRTFYSAPVELRERFLGSLEAYVGFYRDWIDFTSRLQAGWLAASEKVQEKSMEITREPPSAEAYKKLYNIWIETFEKEFCVLFKEPSFAATMGKMMNSTLEFRKKNDELMEVYLRALRIPTKKDLDEVYLELANLRREIRNLSENIIKLAEKTT